MPADPEEFRRARRAADLLSAHHPVIAAALTSYSEHMTAAARHAQVTWDALEADPAARAAHDASGAIITARGYQTMAQIFRDNAAHATAAHKALDEFTRLQRPDEAEDS
jgi:hypothetical protein